MEEMKHRNNVYDLVVEFYEQDQEWNTVIAQKNVESYLRYRTMQGDSEAQLNHCWEVITTLCIYLGNADFYMGDVTQYEIIDFVAWCKRNVADFDIDYDNLHDFFVVLKGIYSFFKMKKLISSDIAPQKAEQLLLVDHKVKLLDVATGEYTAAYAKSHNYIVEDFPAKIFLNIGDKLDKLLPMLKNFFMIPGYRQDMAKALFYFDSIYDGPINEDSKEDYRQSEEFQVAFWDYFLYDYRMMTSGLSPLQTLYDAIKEKPQAFKQHFSLDALKELSEARLILFTVGDEVEDGFYKCHDVFTEQDYVLGLPFDEKPNTKDVLFMGHIFYNDSMIMNFVRGAYMPTAWRKRFIELMQEAKDWYAVGKGGELSWTDFIHEMPLLFLRISMMHAVFRRLDVFNYTSKWLEQKYIPASIPDKTDTNYTRVVSTIYDMLSSHTFSHDDIEIMERMWVDFLVGSNKKPNSILKPWTWSAGVIATFIDLNNAYTLTHKDVGELCEGVPTDAVTRTSKEIKNILQLETNDPRYTNFDGLNAMFLRKYGGEDDM